MPTNRRRRLQYRRADVAELTADTEHHLLHGTYWFEGYGKDRERFEAAWDYHGEDLLAKFIAENPGRRPFAWWLLDHGKERPVVDTSKWAAAWEAGHRSERGKFGFLDSHQWPPLQEDETDYLDRHGLLMAEERALLVV